MENNRKHSRAKLKSHCALVINDGNAHPASLDDLSFSGALVEIQGNADLRVGDTCRLELSFNTTDRTLKRACKIVRQESKKVAVKFTE